MKKNIYCYTYFVEMVTVFCLQGKHDSLFQTLQAKHIG